MITFFFRFTTVHNAAAPSQDFRQILFRRNLKNWRTLKLKKKNTPKKYRKPEKSKFAYSHPPIPMKVVVCVGNFLKLWQE
jgi:hypothetical protein